MPKYWQAFRISLSRQLAYRLNFLLNRLRNILTLLILYYVWIALAGETGQFAGYTTDQLITYVFGAHLLRAFVFGAQSRRIAEEINDGTFSIYLVRPVNHFIFFYFRELSERLILLITAVLEMTALILIIDLHIIVPMSYQLLAISLSVLLAHFLYFIMSYAINLLAFWSREAMGPRFLFEWFLEFASGAYFPLTILVGGIVGVLSFLPFGYLIFFPLSLYLAAEPIPLATLASPLALGLLWLAGTGWLTHLVWRRGLRRYGGEGI